MILRFQDLTFNYIGSLQLTDVTLQDARCELTDCT
jgi:hypothetical protein